MTENGTLAILERLVGFDTVSEKPNLGLIAWVERYLADRGFRVTRFPDETGTKAGICATLGPGNGGILLSGHCDVVPVEGQPWTRNPFRLSVEGERIYGRGTTDMKGFVAASLAAADRAARRPLKAPLTLVLSYDEEIGCVGMRRMIEPLEQVIGRPRACIVGEPTGMRVAIGHKGKTAYRAVCHGQSGHSALAPRFVNALHLVADFIRDLRSLQDVIAVNGARDPGYDIPHATVHVGKLAGGTALNIVPDRAEISFEVRHLAADDPSAIRHRLDAIAASVAGPYRERFSEARIEVEAVNDYPGLDISPDAEIVHLVKSFSDNADTIKVAFGTEAGYFHALAIPTVVCGPGSMEGQGHKPDEYITRAQLGACDAMLDRVLDALCQTPRPAAAR